jgi:hypothetical protein
MTLKKLLEITKPDEYNFISPCGLGDTMFLCALKQFIEEKHNAPVHLIIKPSHKIVVDMYNISGYSIHQFTGDELRGISKSSRYPVKGKLYVAHPMYSDDGSLFEYIGKFNIHFLQFYQMFFRLSKDSYFIEPVKYPDIPANISKDLPCLDKTALLLPEARSVTQLKRGFWEKLAHELREQGLTVVQSYSNKDFKIEGVKTLPDDLYCVTAFAIRCSAVYALRNGLCDIIAGKVRRLTIFYPTQHNYDFFYMDYDNVENILVDMEDKKSAFTVKQSRIIQTLKKKIKKALKKIPPVKQFVNRFNDINKRIAEADSKINCKFAEFYNEMLYLAHAYGRQK